MAPSKVFLTRVAYFPEKRQIVAEFSSTEKKLSRRYTFFPFFYIPNKPSLVGFVKKLGSKRLKVDVVSSSVVRIIGATFSDLQLAAGAILDCFKKEVLLVLPQKQFLIEKNWGYFDAFSEESGELLKSDFVFAPDVFLDFLPASTSRVFSSLQKSGEGGAKDFLDRLALSNILKTCVLDLPDSIQELSGIFLENILFKYGFAFFSSKKSLPVKVFPQEQMSGDGYAKISFLGVLNSLATFPFYNIGFDSVNCSCCSMDGSSAKVSPSSLVSAEFLSDGVYFESALEEWAHQFHVSRPLKFKRLDFMREWSLQSIPVGPFFCGEKAVIPIVDFNFLASKGIVKPDYEFIKKVWFCGKKESFLSAELKENSGLAVQVVKSVKEVFSEKIVSNGILFSKLLSQDYSYFFYQSFLSQLKRISDGMFFLLQDPSTRFFDKRIADSVEAVQCGVVKRFAEFAEQNGSERTRTTDCGAFVKSKNPFFIAKKFCTDFNLPQAEIIF